MTAIESLLQVEHEAGTASFLQKTSTFFRKLLEGHALKPFLIMHFFNAIQSLCGLRILTYYSVDMLSHMPGVLDVYTCTIVLSGCRACTVLVMCLITNRVGRRKLALVSGTCSCVFSCCLGLLLAGGSLIPHHVMSLLTFSLLLAFVISMSFGYLILPSIMIGETQTSSIRGIACGYMFTMNEVILGAILKLYPWLMSTLKINGLFLMFSLSCGVCTIIVYLFLPETQGLTLQQIEDYFRQPNILWTRRNNLSPQECLLKTGNTRPHSAAD